MQPWGDVTALVDVFIAIASIGGVYMSISVALYTILYSRRPESQIEIKYFIKVPFAKYSILIVAVPLILFSLFSMVDLSNPFWYASCFVMAMVFTLVLVISVVRTIMHTYYTLLQNELKGDNFDFMDRSNISGKFRSFYYQKYDDNITLLRLYKNAQKEGGLFEVAKRACTDLEIMDLVDSNLDFVLSSKSYRLFKQNVRLSKSSKKYRLYGFSQLKRGLLTPRIQAPVEVCKLCLNHIYSKKELDNVTLNEVIVVLFFYLMYARAHQEETRVNNAVNRMNYLSPHDTILHVLLAHCLLQKELNRTSEHKRSDFRIILDLLGHASDSNNEFATDNKYALNDAIDRNDYSGIRPFLQLKPVAYTKL